jgi:hypothetical protein
MKIHRIEDEARNVLFVSVAVWASVVAGAAMEDVFAKFEAQGVACIAVIVALYAVAAYGLDREMRTFIQEFSRSALVATACLTVATLAAASVNHVLAIAVFAAPLAAVACVAAVGKLSSGVTRVRGKSRAGTRAVT